MTWGIIGALDKEVELIKNSIEVEKTVELCGSTWYVGSYRGDKVVVVTCSIGKVNAAVCATTMIHVFGADVVVNVGVAGAMDPSLKVLDVVLSESLAYHDVDQELYARYSPFQRSFPGDEKLLAACRAALENMEDRTFSYQTGVIATGDVFVEDKDVKADIARRLRPLCVEMEGAAIAQAAYMNGKPCLVIRAMSDTADEGAHASFTDLLEKAATNSARMVLGMMEHYQG